MFDYDKAKRFFSYKLANDLEGQGRFESALYHTVRMIYEEGLKDGGSTGDAYRHIICICPDCVSESAA